MTDAQTSRYLLADYLYLPNLGPYFARESESFRRCNEDRRAFESRLRRVVDLVVAGDPAAVAGAQRGDRGARHTGVRADGSPRALAGSAVLVAKQRG